jgi:glycerol uptake facilitator protein
VAVVWGFGVTIAIYCSAALSGAHLNPAVSLTFALLRPDSFPRARLLPYCLAQLAGAVAPGWSCWSCSGRCWSASKRRKD